MTRAVTVLATGPQALVEDLGRPGNAHLGVPPSGALDGPALRLANRLVGNPEAAAGIEALLGGLRLRAQCSCTVAVTGPRVRVTAAGRGTGSHVPIHLSPGEELETGQPELGLRCYVGISGGIAVPPELGSRSTDVLSGIGPDPLREGTELPLGDPVGPPVGVDELAPEQPADALTVPVLLGPRDDWFDRPAAQLAEAEWTVSPQSNRVGLRLQGEPLRRAERYADVELPSEAVITGAVQVPAGGRPVIFLADHPTTGGYPVIGVVPATTLPELGQARPGTRIRFRPRQYSDS
jgi:biotin-dependent carboxylase-like uncharacterized protein